MCGIVGLVAPDPAVFTPDDLAPAIAQLRHRGPEAAGAEVFAGLGASCALGHTRLRIIDTSPAADQPLANEDGTVQVVFNGELYNFPELRAELEGRGHRFATGTDTEVLVHLYEEHRDDVAGMLRRLRGMFAFGLFDLTRGRLVLARDRLGIKPLYVAERADGGLVFGSEALALTRGGMVAAGPDTASIAGYLLWGSVPGPRTILAGISEVQPGRAVVWERGRISDLWWWEPSLRDAVRGPDAVPTLAESLVDAVDRHLVADREVGLFLSAGVDSTAVATLAARRGSIRSLTVTFPEADSDEGAEAEATATSLGLAHSSVPVTGAELRDELPTIADAMDQPTSDGVNSWIVSRAARQAGLVVALSGLGGDELFGGYPSFRQVPQAARASRALAPVPTAIRRRAARVASTRTPGGGASRVLMAPTGIGPAYRAVRGLFGFRDLERLGVLAWIGEHDLRRLFDPQLPAHGADDDADRVAYLELTRYMRNQLLRDTDSMAMSHSLEVRVPLLDDRVVEVATAIPSAVRNRPGKATLQEAAGISLDGPKRGFTLPFDDWMRGPLREPIRQGVLDDDLPLSWLIGAEGRRDLWRAFEEGRTHWSRPWAVAMVRMWAQVHELRW